MRVAEIAEEEGWTREEANVQLCGVWKTEGERVKRKAEDDGDGEEAKRVKV